MPPFPQLSQSESVVFDLEFTAWEGSLARGWSAPGEFKELVQIGAVRLDRQTLEETACFEVLVRPRINAELSSYFIALTGITNEEVKLRGYDFTHAYRAFLDFVGAAPMSAFGRDELVFSDNQRLYGLRAERAMPHFVDARPWFTANGFPTQGLHSCDIGPKLGVPFEGREHNALSDARSVAAGIRTLVRRGASNPFSGLS